LPISSWRFARFATYFGRTMKKKRSKKEIYEQARLDAENMPSVRRLRELYERGMAELQEREQAKQQG